MTAYPVIGVATRAAGAANLAAALTTPNASGDTFPPGNDVFLRIKTAGTATTATVINPSANAGPSGTFLAPVTLGGGALPATSDALYGPFPANAYADPSDGQVHITYTSVVAVTVGVYRVAQS